MAHTESIEASSIDKILVKKKKKKVQCAPFYTLLCFLYLLKSNIYL